MCLSFGQKYYKRENVCFNYLNDKKITLLKKACREFAQESVKKYTRGFKKEHKRNEQFSKCLNTCSSMVQTAGFSWAHVLPVMCLLVLMIGLGVSYKRYKLKSRSTNQKIPDDRRKETLTSSSTV